MSKLNTIKVGGSDYAKVATRLKEFLEDHKSDISIETSYEWKDGYVIFMAVVNCSRGKFTGHSLGQVSKTTKQFEKQETIAVGRALAFAGYLASGDIASFEEMQDYEREAKSEVSESQYQLLKRDWWSAIGGSIDEDQAGFEFRKWVVHTSGMDEFTVSDYREWTAEDFAKCRKALEEMTASALAESGLTTNGGQRSP